jgi:hypothetical protein
VVDTAVSETSPPLALTVVGGARAESLRITAVVVRLTMLIATEPAMPTVPAPAPEVASASSQ